METCSNPEQRTIISLQSTHAYLLNNKLLKDLQHLFSAVCVIKNENKNLILNICE